MSAPFRLCPRRFTLSLQPELAEKMNAFMTANEMTSPSVCANYLISMAFAVTPEHGIATADRSRAYNEVRMWSLTQVAQAHKAIAKLLEATAATIPVPVDK